MTALNSPLLKTLESMRSLSAEAASLVDSLEREHGAELKDQVVKQLNDIITSQRLQIAELTAQLAARDNPPSTSFRSDSEREEFVLSFQRKISLMTSANVTLHHGKGFFEARPADDQRYECAAALIALFDSRGLEPLSCWTEVYNLNGVMK